MILKPSLDNLLRKSQKLAYKISQHSTGGWALMPLVNVLSARRLRGAATVLVYHSVSHQSGNPLVSGTIHNVNPEVLYEQLSLLKRHCVLISVDELSERILKHQPVDGLAAISFDDGYLSVLKNAAPILQNLDIPATFFLATKLIQDGTFWRDKVRYIINQELEGDFLSFARPLDPAFDGVTLKRFYRDTKDPAIITSRLVEQVIDEFLKSLAVDIDAVAKDVYCRASHLIGLSYPNLTFGNHTHSHYVLSSMSKDDQYQEIKTAEDILRGLNLPLSGLISLPFGGGRDFNADTLEILQDLGYSGYAMSWASLLSGPPNDKSGVAGPAVLQTLMPANNRSFLLERRG